MTGVPGPVTFIMAPPATFPITQCEKTALGSLLNEAAQRIHFPSGDQRQSP